MTDTIVLLIVIIKLDRDWIRSLSLRKLPFDQSCHIFSLINDLPAFRRGTIHSSLSVAFTVSSGISAPLSAKGTTVVTGISDPNLLKRSLIGVSSVTTGIAASDSGPGAPVLLLNVLIGTSPRAVFLPVLE